jgi:hypothetical protein
MANFKTHITVAAGASGMLATLCLGAKLASPQQVIALAAMGTIGGILPDIDSDHSTPVKILFTVLGGILAFLVMFSQADQYSLLELWMLWGLVYGLVRYVLYRLFADFTEHRGIFHSLVAALFFWFLTTTLVYQLFDVKRDFAWLTGFFVFFGFIVHLSLDELYSVDLLGRRFKKSFGTALKIVDLQDWKVSGLFILAMILMYLMTPSADTFWASFTNSTTYMNLWQRFWPQGSWFGL